MSRLFNLLVIVCGLLIVGMMLGGAAPSRFGEALWALTAAIQSWNCMAAAPAGGHQGRSA